LPDLSAATARRLAGAIMAARRAGDIVVVSIHWGPNWGYAVDAEQRSFARAIIDSGAVDVVHGHSSHHPKGIEVYHGRPILYGCGDFINDYEGISGYERYRGDLVAMYLIGIGNGGDGIVSLRIVPLRMRRFALTRASHVDAEWLRRKIEQASPGLEGRFELAEDDSITLQSAA
jgi:poly-gamma-glutamate synthesis protein (capsule biosynthesis protein)